MGITALSLPLMVFLVPTYVYHVYRWYTYMGFGMNGVSLVPLLNFTAIFYLG